MAYRSTPVADLGDLLAAPVLASIDADAQAARHFLRFIDAFGFTEPNAEGQREPAYFTFTFAYASGGKPSSMTVSLPVLSLVPLPLLSMAKATFDYSLQIVDLRSDSDTTRPTLRAMFAAPGSARQPPGAMNVSMSVETSDLPAGIARLLNLTSDAVRAD